MALDYEDRLDFRAFDILITAIDNASPDQLRKAIKDCNEIASNYTFRASKRAIYKDMAKLLRAELKR